MNRIPRPLPLHLMTALCVWGGAPSAAMVLAGLGQETALPPIKGLQALRQYLPDTDHDLFIKRVAERAQDRLQRYLAGLDAYRHHPYRRKPTGGDIVWQLGQVTVRAYGAGQPVFLIPSLINPSWVLDLMPGRSLVEGLVEAGYRPHLLDWGDVGASEDPQESRFGITDYILKRLVPAFTAVSDKQPVPVIGYCIGGVLAVALASLHPDQVKQLVLLAAPWDFSAQTAREGASLAPLLAAHAKTPPLSSPIPGEMMQAYFKMIDPALDERKFRRFADLDPNSKDAEFFVALEDWANTGPALSRPAAIDILETWYERGDPARGAWLVGDHRVDPARFGGQSLVVTPTSDRLVPYASSSHILTQLANCTHLSPEAGHVGMIVGNKARSQLWSPLIDFLGKD